MKAGTLSAFGERLHTTAYTPKQEPSLPWPQHSLELQAKSSPKEQPEEADARLMACVRFLRRRGPAGLRDLFLLLSELWLTHHVFSAFRMCETRGGITTLGVLCVLPKLPAPAC